MKNTKKTVTYILKLFSFVLALIFCVSPLFVFAAEDKKDEEEKDPTKATVTYTKGHYFRNPLTGREATDIFTGTVPEPQTVTKGESVTLVENTIVFRDYIFDGWRYSYTVEEDGKEVEKEIIYQPGDVIENLTEDIQLAAVWKRCEVDGLKFTGWLTYKKGDVNVGGEQIPPEVMKTDKEITILPCPYDKDGHSFTAWKDARGRLYYPGDKFMPETPNLTLTPLWTVEDGAVVTHRVVYNSGEQAEITGNPPDSFDLYEKKSFKVAKCNLKYPGYNFIGWETENGKIYKPGDICSAEGEKTVFSPVWEKTKEIYKIVPTFSAGGSVTPNKAAEVTEGDKIRFDFTPSEGFFVSTVKVNGEKVEFYDNFYEFTPTSDAKIYVEFSKKPDPVIPDESDTSSPEKPKESFEIKIVTTPGGHAEIIGENRFFAGQSASVEIKPDEGFKISKVKIGKKDADVHGGKVKIENIQSDITLEITFEPLAPTETDEKSYIPVIIAAVLLFVSVGIFCFIKLKH